MGWERGAGESGKGRRGGEEGEERCKEANTKFKIQPCSSIKINATRTQSCVIKLCVLLNVTAYSELSSYVSIPRATDIYLPLCPLLHLFLSLSLFFSLHISVSLPCSINCKWSVLRWNTLWAGLHGWQLCVCVYVCVFITAGGRDVILLLLCTIFSFLFIPFEVIKMYCENMHRASKAYRLRFLPNCK